MPNVPNELTDWLDRRRRESGLHFEPVTWEECREWSLIQGEIARNRGGFFTVRGFRLKSPHRRWNNREQPLIDQPGPGILGFLGRRTSGARTDLLVQAKTEPGNILGTQLAPTVQATVSNYTRVHGGHRTPHLEHFLAPQSASVSVDVEQSEQGTMFLGKYNRNILIMDGLGRTEPGMKSLKWVAAHTLLQALAVDFAVNTDARSVLCCSNWRDLSSPAMPFDRWRGTAEFGELLHTSYSADAPPNAPQPPSEWITDLRSRQHFDRQPVALDLLTSWSISSDGLLKDAASKFVRLFDVKADDREIAHWQQPLIGQLDSNRVVVLCQERRGVLQFLLRAAFEPGFREGVQLGPTAQSQEVAPPDEPLAQYALAAGQTVLSVEQSEEGGRFFQVINRYEIRLIEDSEQPPHDANARWLTLADIHRLARSRGFLTNELRSAISLLLTKL